MTPDEWTGDSGWTTPEDEATAGQARKQSKLQRRSEREEQRLADWRLRQKRLQRNLENPLPRIVRIISVVDTRDYEEDPTSDRWVPVPGSGTEHACDRCGRSHEVLATVELEDGKTAIVGTGCARGESMEIQQQLKAGAAFAKKATALHHQIEAAAPLRALKQQIEDKVNALRIPDIVLTTNKFSMWTFVAEDASIPVRYHGEFEPLYDRPELTAYYRNQLVRAWRANRLKELGWHDVAAKLKASEKAAERLKRLAAYDPTKG